MRFYKNGPDGMPYYEAQPENWYRFVKDGVKLFGCYATSKTDAVFKWLEEFKMSCKEAGVEDIQEFEAPTI